MVRRIIFYALTIISLKPAGRLAATSLHRALLCLIQNDVACVILTPTPIPYSILTKQDLVVGTRSPEVPPPPSPGSLSDGDETPQRETFRPKTLLDGVRTAPRTYTRTRRTRKDYGIVMYNYIDRVVRRDFAVEGSMRK